MLSKTPSRAALFHAGTWAGSHLMRRKRPSMAGTALKGLGAAAVAVPLGIWVGRTVMNLNRTQDVMDATGGRGSNARGRQGSAQTSAGTRTEGEDNR